ncbi:MAG: tetratricopeptide repeat protein, partial [Promethearchaeota archaeon]
MNYKRFLNESRQNFGDSPRKFGFFSKSYLKIKPPSWLDRQIKVRKRLSYKYLTELYNRQELLYKYGKVVWGCIIHANVKLFERGKFDSPAAIVYSLNEILDDDLTKIISVSNQLYSLKGKQTDPELQKISDKLAGEFTIDLKLSVPTKITSGIKYYYAVTVVIRKHLPESYLAGKFFPLLVCPEKTDACMILPSKFWSKEFISKCWMGGKTAEKYNKKGLSDLKSKCYNSAIKNFDKAVKLNPLDLIYHNNLGYTYYLAGEFDNAISAYTIALELNPTDSRTLFGIARIYFTQNKLSKAIQKYEQIYEVDPDFKRISIPWVECLNSLGRYEESTKMIKLFLEDQESMDTTVRAIFCNYWGVALIKLNKFDEAIDKFEQALNFKPDFGLVYENWAFVLDLLGLEEESNQKFQQAIDILSQKDDSSELIDVYTSWIRSLFAKNEIEAANEEIEALLKIDPNNPVALNYKAKGLFLKGNPEEALGIYQKIIESSPYFGLAYSNYIFTLGNLGKFDEIQPIYERTLKLNLNDPRIERTYAFVLVAQNKLNEANLIFQKAIDKDPMLLEVYFPWIECLMRLEDYHAVIEKVKTVLSIDSENAEAYNYWGVALLNLKEFNESIQKFEHAVKLNSEFSLAYENLGFVHFELGQFEQALTFIEKATKVNPFNFQALFLWGLGLRHLGNYEGALEKFEQLITLIPKHSMGYYQFGITLNQLGQLDEAHKNIQKAIELEPNNGMYYNALGINAMGRDLIEQAFECFKKAIELNPEL